jgi:hypothetical protein
MSLGGEHNKYLGASWSKATKQYFLPKEEGERCQQHGGLCLHHL